MADPNQYSDPNSDGFHDSGHGVIADAGDTTGDYSNWGWKEIEAAILGAGGTDDPSYITNPSDPQTIQDAADTLYYTQRVLEGIYQGIAEQTDALTGADGPWQGQAAQAFSGAMKGLAQQTKTMADNLSGGGSYPSIPQELANDAQHLREAMAKIKDIDTWYANQAVRIDPELQMDNGLVRVSANPQIVQMMTTNMRQVLQALAKHYALTASSVTQPSSPTNPNNTGAPGSSTGPANASGDGSGYTFVPGGTGGGYGQYGGQPGNQGYGQQFGVPFGPGGADGGYGQQYGLAYGPGGTNAPSTGGQDPTSADYYGGANQDPYGEVTPGEPGMESAGQGGAIGQAVDSPVPVQSVGQGHSVPATGVDPAGQGGQRRSALSPWVPAVPGVNAGVPGTPGVMGTPGQPAAQGQHFTALLTQDDVPPGWPTYPGTNSPLPPAPGWHFVKGCKTPQPDAPGQPAVQQPPAGAFKPTTISFGPPGSNPGSRLATQSDFPPGWPTFPGTNAPRPPAAGWHMVQGNTTPQPDTPGQSAQLSMTESWPRVAAPATGVAPLTHTDGVPRTGVDPAVRGEWVPATGMEPNQSEVRPATLVEPGRGESMPETIVQPAVQGELTPRTLVEPGQGQLMPERLVEPPTHTVGVPTTSVAPLTHTDGVPTTGVAQAQSAQLSMTESWPRVEKPATADKQELAALPGF